MPDRKRPLGATLLIVLTAALLMVPTLPRAASAQIDPFEKVHEKKGPINITAGQVEYDKEHKIVTATGNAKATQQDFSIEAEKLIYHDLEHRLEAVGNVVMREWENVYKADRMVINTEDESGVLINGEVYIVAGNFQLCGSRVEKLPDDRYHVEDGIYTTCVCPPDQKPSWTLHGSTMNVNYGSYGAVTNARLHAKGIPVFYFPKLAFPAPRERQSGFLFPDIYYTSRKGFSTSLPFYWAIAKNVDATIEPVFMSKRGAGGDLELRYVLSRQGRGDAHLSYLDEFLFQRVAPPTEQAARQHKLGDQPPQPSVEAFKPPASLQRWEFKATHSQEWTPTLSSGANIHFLSDDLYWELASRRFDARKPFTASTLTSSKSWPGTVLTASARYFQDLVPTGAPLCKPDPGSDPNAPTISLDKSHGTCNRIQGLDRPVTYQRLPEVKFGTSLYDRDLAPLGLALNSEVIRFYRFPDEPVPEYVINNPVGLPIEAYRMILTPNTSLPYDLWGYFDGSVKFETDQYVYYVPDYISGTTQTFSVLRPTAEIRTNLVRLYKFPFGPIRKIRHDVQPTLRYRLVNPVSLPNRIGQSPEDTTLLEPPPPLPIPPEPGGPGPGLHSFGLYGFDNRDAIGKEEVIELVFRNQFPTTLVGLKGQEFGINPFELTVTQPISVNELKRQDVKQSALTGGFESHYKYNLSGYQRQRQAEQMGLVAVEETFKTAPPRQQEVDDIVPTKDEHRPLMPLLVELRSRAIRDVDIQMQTTVDPYYGREFQKLTAYLEILNRFRFRRLGMKYTFGARSLKPQNGPDPDIANADDPFFVHSQYLEPVVRFYLHPRFVIGGDANYNLTQKSPYRRGGIQGIGKDKPGAPLHRTGLSYGSGILEYYSACRCWSAFIMAGRRLIGARQDFTLQAIVDPNGRAIFDDDWIFQFGLNLEGLIALGQRPDY